jgi:hypothetical protein
VSLAGFVLEIGTKYLPPLKIMSANERFRGANATFMPLKRRKANVPLIVSQLIFRDAEGENNSCPIGKVLPGRKNRSEAL